MGATAVAVRSFEAETETEVGSGCPLILVNNPAEHVAAADLAGVRLVLTRRWDRELKSAVRTSLVVVLDVFGQHGLEMAPGVHQEVVEALFAYGSHPPFRECIRFGRTNRGADRFDADGGEHVAKVVVNFVSLSRTRNRNRRPAGSRSAAKLRATWVTQAMAGLVVTPRRRTTRLSTSMTKST
jgi:hypothetical protein